MNDNTIATVPAKTLKELSRWCSSGAGAKRRPALATVFYEGGWLYATDSYRIARVHVGEHPELDGAVLDPETFDRMTARDAAAVLESDGVRLGRTLIPYDRDREGIANAKRLFGKRRDDSVDVNINPLYLADLAKLARAMGCEAVNAWGDKHELHARMEAGGLVAEAIIMPIRR